MRILYYRPEKRSVEEIKKMSQNYKKSKSINLKGLNIKKSYDSDEDDILNDFYEKAM